MLHHLPAHFHVLVKNHETHLKIDLLRPSRFVEDATQLLPWNFQSWHFLWLFVAHSELLKVGNAWLITKLSCETSNFFLWATKPQAVPFRRCKCPLVWALDLACRVSLHHVTHISLHWGNNITHHNTTTIREVQVIDSDSTWSWMVQIQIIEAMGFKAMGWVSKSSNELQTNSLNLLVFT